MLLKLQENIDVVLLCKHQGNIIMPYKIRWRNREYIIKKLGYRYREKVGKTFFHIFHVTDDSLAFRLRLDPNNLHWTIEEVSDGLAD